MQISGGGAANVGSSNITDGAIINADINAAAGIALSKLSGLIGNPGSFISIETTYAATHSLTTVANQQVLVFATCDVSGTANTIDATLLSYNGVEKHRINSDRSGVGYYDGIFLMYTEIPGAGTANITLTSGATMGNPKIIVIKMMIG